MIWPVPPLSCDPLSCELLNYLIAILRQVTDKMGLLEHFYTKFSKSFVASMTVELARGTCVVKERLLIICSFMYPIK